MIDFLFNPKGRISRKGYLVAFLLPYLALTQMLPLVIGGGFGVIFSLFLLWPKFVSVPIRRFHDMGLTGLYQLGFAGLFILSTIVTFQGFVEHIGNVEAFAALSIEDRMQIMTEAFESNDRVQLGVFMTFSVELAQALFFGLVRGNVGSNQFGDDPLVEGRGFAD